MHTLTIITLVLLLFIIILVTLSIKLKRPVFLSIAMRFNLLICLINLGKSLYDFHELNKHSALLGILCNLLALVFTLYCIEKISSKPHKQQ